MSPEEKKVLSVHVESYAYSGDSNRMEALEVIFEEVDEMLRRAYDAGWAESRELGDDG